MNFHPLCGTLLPDWSSFGGADPSPLVLRVHTLILELAGPTSKVVGTDIGVMMALPDGRTWRSTVDRKMGCTEDKTPRIPNAK